ncbi:DUF397 domain-containing protein [Verminephrobacter aporrectodeae subsp. tuberculatae]|uniref:DUF397 domain-containing protein n=1 Tax=Verminephrobacter aporrectodeae TaxID=1110389 RepID=UPI0022442A14|nr:DUF397 domain-containing protein [Verminephrobacter aporrectodeae]MCW8206083.1 DUF397 domain-containing protein [Verminephrobacter aporrectodeae subsp. tuberculatae]
MKQNHGTEGFKKSSFSSSAAYCCVSVQIDPEKVLVRDTKDTFNTTLTFNHNEWKAFIKGVKGGEFDV